MGRTGRYTLSVMAWVAAYAGWSSIVGLIVAAVTGDAPRRVSVGASALLTVVIPAVPTLVALWFNDWARDGFPSREQQRARRAAAPAEPAATAVENAPAPGADAVQRPAPERVERPAPRAAVPAPVPPAPQAGGIPTVQAHPLGVPEAAYEQPAGPGEFPVSPLLRDRR